MIITKIPAELPAAIALIEDEFKDRRVTVDTLGTDDCPPFGFTGELIAIARPLGSIEPLLIVQGGDGGHVAIRLDDIAAIGHAE